MQKGFATILLLIGILIIISVIGGIYYFSKTQSSKICPTIVSSYKNLQTGECDTFTGCEKIPNGWVLTYSCFPTSKPTNILQPTQVSNETANWKTYTNKRISFKYPEDWMEGPPYISTSQTIVQFQYQLTTVLTLSQVSTNEKTRKPYTSLDEYVGSSRAGISKDIVIDGYPAKRMITSTIPPELSGHTIPYEEVVLFTPDKSAIISLHYEKDYYNKSSADKVLDQILTTFKFLDQNQDKINNLLQISYSGGLCPNGPCSSTTTILKDGSFLVDNKLKTKISEQEINELQSLITNTNFESIKAVKFTGVCPTAFDGPEITYIFYTSKVQETIASCQVKIDLKSPLFTKIDQIISKTLQTK